MPVREHTLEEYRSPTNITLRCSCGWSYTVTRRQNALARAAKIRAAKRRHAEDERKEATEARSGTGP